MLVCEKHQISMLEDSVSDHICEYTISFLLSLPSSSSRLTCSINLVKEPKIRFMRCAIILAKSGRRLAIFVILLMPTSRRHGHAENC